MLMCLKDSERTRQNHGKMVPVSHNMTICFQPLDLTVNRSRKSFLRDKSQLWYAEQVQTQIVAYGLVFLKDLLCAKR